MAGRIRDEDVVLVLRALGRAARRLPGPMLPQVDRFVAALDAGALLPEDF